MIDTVLTKIRAVTFFHDWWWWAPVVAFAVVMAVHALDRWRRRELTARIGDLPLVRRIIATRSPGRMFAKDLLTAFAAALLVLAMARPQVVKKQSTSVRGLDLVIAVDVSKSMLVDDVGPTALMTKRKLPTNRLERARELATWVVDELPDDRIGPVVFAGAASHFPLTEDHEVAVRFLNDLGPADLPQGSNLDEVLRVSRCMLRPDLYDDLACSRVGRQGRGGDPLAGETEEKALGKREEDEELLQTKIERGKAIAIFTDGGDPDPSTLAEVQKARALGIAVFIIGVGTEKGGVVFEVDPYTGKRTSQPKTDAAGANVISKRGDAGMRALAEAGGDAKRFFVASERGELDPTALVTALEQVNRGLATRKVKAASDVFEPFVFAGLMLLVIELAISTRRRRNVWEAT